MSQKSVLLAMLKMGPVCSQSFYTDERITHRVGARIKDLRDDGWTITSRPCKSHDHVSSAVVYQLETQDQMSLAL